MDTIVHFTGVDSFEVFPSLVIAQDSGGQRLVTVICALGASAFVAVTGTLFYCRNRVMQTLKSGKVFQAVMTDLHETGSGFWGQRRVQTTVEYMLDGEKQAGGTNVYNLSVSLAKVYCRTRKPVRILVHPTNPNYIL